MCAMSVTATPTDVLIDRSNGFEKITSKNVPQISPETQSAIFNGGHWNFDPILTWPFMTGAVASCMSLTLTQWSCDPLPRPQLGLAEARSSYVSRIAQHRPHRRSFPPRDSFASRDSALVEHSRNRIDAGRLLNVSLEHKAYHIGFAFKHLVVGCRRIALLHVSITVRRSG